METQSPGLTLTCVDVDRCTVYVEPWGTELVLKRAERLCFESDAFLSGDVEVSLVPTGISVVFSSNSIVRITDRNGQNVPF